MKIALCVEQKIILPAYISYY